MTEPLPEPPVPEDADLRGTPMPRELLVKMAMHTWGVSERDADQLVQEFFARGPQ